jgi:hypothetical protein
LGVGCLAALPSRGYGQYNCPVAIEFRGKAVLEGRIRDVERPSTDVLWEEKLKTLSFSPTEYGKDRSDLKAGEKTKLEGELRVVIDGAGHVSVKELHLVRNKFDTSAWVIAPEDFKRILELRKASSKGQPNK